MPLQLTFPEGGALVVGGTGRVGQGIVRQMAAAGVPLVFTYRGAEFSRPVHGSPRGIGAEPAEALAAELRELGHDVACTRMDMVDEGSIQAAIDLVIARSGRLHSVLCAAGPPVPFRRLADFTAEEVDEFFRGDMLAYFRLYRRTCLFMRESGGGAIVGTSTMATRRVIDFDGLCVPSKAGIEAMARQIAAEEGPHGIRCNTVGIGWVGNYPLDYYDSMLDPVPDGPPVTEKHMFDHLLRHNMANARLGRNARAEEAGTLYAFLASEQASYITGQTICFDGGTAL